MDELLEQSLYFERCLGFEETHIRTARVWAEIIPYLWHLPKKQLGRGNAVRARR